MTSKTTKKFAPEVRELAVHMVLDHVNVLPSRWVALGSVDNLGAVQTPNAGFPVSPQAAKSMHPRWLVGCVRQEQ